MRLANPTFFSEKNAINDIAREKKRLLWPGEIIICCNEKLIFCHEKRNIRFIIRTLTVSISNAADGYVS